MSYTNEIQQSNALVQDMRPYILDAMLAEFGDKCAICGNKDTYYEIDHKRYAEDITIYDLQLLCESCHSNKTMASNEYRLTGCAHCRTCTCYK